MTTRDKVAMILTKYGYSIEEGFALCEKCGNEDAGEMVQIDVAKDIVVWMTDLREDGDAAVHLSIWKKYRADFCLSYALAGAVALDDEDLGIEDEEDKSLMIEFLKNCHDNWSHSRPMPVLPESLQWLFASAGTSDFVDMDSYHISEDSVVEIVFSNQE